MQGSYILVNRFDSVADLLKIDSVNGDAKIISSDQVDERNISFGLFEAERDRSSLEFVALLATPDGPLLYLKDIQYRPEIGKTSIKIKDDTNFSHFLVTHEGRHVFGLFYERKFGIGLHPYNNSREDIDFYYWLSKNVGNAMLYKTYTKGIKYVD